MIKLTDLNDIRGVIKRLEYAFEEPYYWSSDVVRFVAELIKKFEKEVVVTLDQFVLFIVQELGSDPNLDHEINRDIWEDYWDE